MLSTRELRTLEALNLEIKKELVNALMHMGYGHFGGSLSITETLACLYGHYLKHNPQNPNSHERDFFVLSKGHAGPALYATLAIRGFFDKAWLNTINQNGTRLPSHADMNKTPGIDMTTGSLGQGFSCAVGMAIGTKRQVFTIVGDGELQEGQCWEAVQLAAHLNLNNLLVFIDYNKRQLDGFIDDIQRPFDLRQKFEAFGFHALQVNGGDIPSIANAIESHKAQSSKPTAIILDTVKGQGCPSIENIAANHHLRLNDDLISAIKNDVTAIENKLEALNEH
ncbi:transketolase [Vibrio sp. NTOU-M3]|uniref:transketolase n=1 Tax=Vibrio sp. NTOU-M3 TaxID=3234954 RepID=UPI00349FC71B